MSVVINIHARRCTHRSSEGRRCVTLLCRFNPGPECYVHTAMRYPRPEPIDPERLMLQREQRIAA